MENNNSQPKYEDLQLLKRKWFPLWILDRYILREFLIKYSILLLVFIILFILSDVFNDGKDFFEAKAGVRPLVLYLLCRLPGNIRFILPISMLLGCMWTMAEFGKKLEITAMRASGVSLFRCGCPILFVGLIVTMVNIYFNEALIPYTQTRSEQIYNHYADRRKSVQYNLTFRSDDDKRNWFFKTFKSGNVQNDVSLKTYWHKKMIKTLVGTYGTKEYTANIRKIFGASANVILALPQEKMESYILKNLEGRKMDIYAQEVEFDGDKHLWIFRKGTFVSYDRTDELKFAASSGVSIMHNDLPFEELVFDDEMMPETRQVIISSVKEKDDLPTVFIFDLLRRSPNMPARVKAIYMTVFFYRLAFPWACFLSVFLGIPLATKNERTGSMVAIISAVVMILLYIITAQTFLTLGKSGVINPAVAGLTPTIAFIAAGAWRLIKDRN